VHPLEPPGQQRHLVLSKHIELLIWQRHQRGQGEHPGGWVSVRFSFRATDEGETMRVSRALNLGCHTPIHLNQLELREQLRQGVTQQWPRTFSPKPYDLASVRARRLYHDHHTGAHPHWPTCCSPPP
jgi:hypothetical protein